jgi:hypothetical protein
MFILSNATVAVSIQMLLLNLHQQQGIRLAADHILPVSFAGHTSIGGRAAAGSTD